MLWSDKCQAYKFESMNPAKNLSSNLILINMGIDTQPYQSDIIEDGFPSGETNPSMLPSVYYSHTHSLERNANDCVFYFIL